MSRIIISTAAPKVSTMIVLYCFSSGVATTSTKSFQFSHSTTSSPARSFAAIRCAPWSRSIKIGLSADAAKVDLPLFGDPKIIPVQVVFLLIVPPFTILNILKLLCLCSFVLYHIFFILGTTLKIFLRRPFIKVVARTVPRFVNLVIDGLAPHFRVDKIVACIDNFPAPFFMVIMYFHYCPFGFFFLILLYKRHINLQEHICPFYQKELLVGIVCNIYTISFVTLLPPLFSVFCC